MGHPLRRGKAARLLIFQRQRPGVVPARELHQRVDPGIDRRMRGKEVGEAFARIVDAHFHDGGIGGVQFAAPLDLAQRRDHGVGIFGELDRACVGEELAAARQAQSG